MFRRRISKLRFKTGMAKFGRKEKVEACVIVNGDFETGYLTPWVTWECYVTSVTIEVENSNHFARMQT